MRYLCFDIESCDGGSAGSICSFGYALLDDSLKVIGCDDLLVNPAVRFNPMLLRGKVKLSYPEKAFRAAPDFASRYAEIRRLLSCDAAIGFSVQNDVKYVIDDCKYYGLPDIDYSFYDVQLIYSIFKGERRLYSLGDAAAEFDLGFTAHRSSEDALVTARILAGVCKAENCDFKQLICRYALRAGKAEGGLTRKCESLLPQMAADLSSKSMRRRLLGEFLLELPAAKGRGVRYCFDEDIELDIDASRGMIAKLVSLGGRYTQSAAECDVFVRGDMPGTRCRQAQRRKKTVVTLKEFVGRIGGYEKLVIDDRRVLENRDIRIQKLKKVGTRDESKKI